MITATTTALPPLSQVERAAIAILPRSIDAHDTHMATLPCMTRVEVAGAAEGMSLDFPLTVAAWNLERCLYPDRSAAKLAATSARVILLSEMDNGMARTAQRHTTADVADALRMQFAYGVEFIELGLGSATERPFCHDAHNALGLHGNALLAATTLHQPFMVRLAGRRRWFMEGGDQPRMGERMAIGAVVATTEGPMVAVSTHLESNAGVAERRAQVAGLIDALALTFPDLPIVIGGDLNTGNHTTGDWRSETLFAHAAGQGFAAHGGAPDQMTTRASRITRYPERAMKLDWFLTRGVQVERSWIVPSLDDTGIPLSDHDLIALTITGLGQG